MKVIYLLLTLINATKIIKNIDIPACRNCIHYKPSAYNSDFTASYNKCGKFGDKDIITDKISYDIAELCRKDELRCGSNARYFEKEPNINMKILKHTIVSNMTNNILLLLPFLYILAGATNIILHFNGI
jgi:hypothetical protein